MNVQKYPISDPHTNIRSGSASSGLFICTSTTPFDYSTLTGDNVGRMGYAVKLVTRDGSNGVMSLIETNGVIGDVPALTSGIGWLSGEGFGMEITKLEVAAGTIAFIYLKETPEKLL